MAWKTLDDMDLAGKTVLARVDINVPVEDGRVTDATRIERIKPTIDTLLAAGAKPVLLAHFDRPKGKRVPGMSLAVTRGKLAEVLGVEIAFAEDCVGDVAQAAVDALAVGQVLLLENTRFHPGEEKNDEAFARQLAALGDIYCNDAFSAAHRAHASTEALARLLPACAGRLMEAELKALEAALSAPDRPVVAVVGGAKVSTKLDLLGNLLAKVDTVVIGGGMANTFLAAQGIDVGKSLCEHEMTDTAAEIAKRAEAQGCRLMLPRDVVVAQPLALGPAPGSGSATLVELEPQRVRIQAECAQACLVVLTDLDYPGWRATVDGEPSAIVTSNGLYRGVVVPAGRHEIEHRYRPVAFTRGAVAGALLLCATLGAALWARRRGKLEW